MRKYSKKKEERELRPGPFPFPGRPSGEKPPGARKQEQLPGLWKKRLFFAGCMECYPGE